jgi:predicted DNA-binding transcriptional regulator YafY
MLALLSLLQARRDWPGLVLADRLGVTPRTIRRDIDHLRGLGYAIEMSKGLYGGYRLAAGSELPPMLFDDEQAVALAVALQNAPATGVDIDEAAARALTTVRQVMPSRLRHRIDGIGFARAASAVAVDPAVLESVSIAVRDVRTIRFEYARVDGYDGPGDRPPRHAEPHALVSWSGLWYLIAWDLDRADWRIFRLDRVTPKTGGVPFTRRELPASDARTFLAARFRGSESDPGWPCTGEFVVQLSAREVAPWIGDGEFEELPDGTTRVVVGSWSWSGVLAFATRFDVPFTIVGPEPLRAAAAVLAERFASAARS